MLFLLVCLVFCYELVWCGVVFLNWCEVFDIFRMLGSGMGMDLRYLIVE